MKRRWILAGGLAMAMFLFTACGKNSGQVKLDPDKPVAVTVWHYYNGTQQAAFDRLVEEFNATVGEEKGIHVIGHSQGSVDELESNVLATINKEVGSQETPNIFSSYADTAYMVEKMGKLADISKYMTDKEMETYVDSFIEEGKIGENGELKIFPTAKSSEVFMINKNAWEEFSAATGASLEELETKEGLVKVAERYYEWTDSLTPDEPNDGKAFYGRDAMANLFIVGSMQLGKELFAVENGKVNFQVDKDIMRRIWDFYYVPYIKGYFKAYGRFRSDDLKIGEIISFTGSSTSAIYFPDEVEIDGKKEPIGYITMKVPKFEGGKDYAVQQGAGMVVVQGTPEEEYASVEFLKWFTQEENNLEFACTAGYLPVKKNAFDKESLDKVIEEQKLDVPPKTYDSLLVGFDTVKTNTLYTNMAFENGTEARKVLEYNLSDKAVADREKVSTALQNRQSLEEATAPFLTDEAFEEWMAQFEEALLQTVKE